MYQVIKGHYLKYKCPENTMDTSWYLENIYDARGLNVCLANIMRLKVTSVMCHRRSLSRNAISLGVGKSYYFFFFFWSALLVSLRVQGSNLMGFIFLVKLFWSLVARWEIPESLWIRGGRWSGRTRLGYSWFLYYLTKNKKLYSMSTFRCKYRILQISKRCPITDNVDHKLRTSVNMWYRHLLCTSAEAIGSWVTLVWISHLNTSTEKAKTSLSLKVHLYQCCISFKCTSCHCRYRCTKLTTTVFPSMLKVSHSRWSLRSVCF